MILERVPTGAPDLVGDNPCTVTVSASLKVTLGNYESAEAFVSVAGIPAAADEAEVQRLVEESMDSAGVAWKVIRQRVLTHARDLRKLKTT